MGGVLILLSITLSTLCGLTCQPFRLDRGGDARLCAIGWVDDWRKVVNKDPEGMPAREATWQSLIGLVAAIYLAFSVSETQPVSSSCL